LIHITLIHVPLIHVHLIHVPLIHIPLIHVTLIHVPLIYVTLIHVPLIHVPLIHVPLIRVPLILFRTMYRKRSFSYTLLTQIFYTILSHINALLYDPPIPSFFMCSHLVKRTIYEVHLRRIFSNLLLEILLGPLHILLRILFSHPSYKYVLQHRTRQTSNASSRRDPFGSQRPRHTVVYIRHTEYRYLRISIWNDYRLLLI
jgi:hypothetical protein